VWCKGEYQAVEANERNSQMPEFKEGAVVRLKSGGPKMTIDTIDKFGATCVWFDGGERKEGLFKLDSLEIARD
jgi:uncharacterized protein YodC (DUF2158 family)